MEILLTTTGTVSPVVIPEWGNRPFVLLNEFKVEEIRSSESIFSVLDNGWITLTDEYGRSVTTDNLWQLDDNQGLIDVLNIEGIEGLSADSIDGFNQLLLVYTTSEEHNSISLGVVLSNANNFANTDLDLTANRTHDLNGNILLISEDVDNKRFLFDEAAEGYDFGFNTNNPT